MSTNANAAERPTTPKRAMAKLVLRSRRALGLPDCPPSVAAEGDGAAVRWVAEVAGEWLRVIADEVEQELWDDALTEAIKAHTSTFPIVPAEVRVAGLRLQEQRRIAARYAPTPCHLCAWAREHPEARKTCPYHGVPNPTRRRVSTR